MFIDYNLFGMNFVNVDAVKFRLPVPDDSAASSGTSGNVSCHTAAAKTSLLHSNNTSFQHKVAQLRELVKPGFHYPS